MINLLILFIGGSIILIAVGIYFYLQDKKTKVC